MVSITNIFYEWNHVETLFSRESTEVEAAVSIFSRFFFLPQLIFILIFQTREVRNDCGSSLFVFICTMCYSFMYLLGHLCVRVPAEHCQWRSPWILRGHRHPERSKQTTAPPINTPPDLLCGWLSSVENIIFLTLNKINPNKSSVFTTVRIGIFNCSKYKLTS